MSTNTKKTKKNVAIILAAGGGTRFRTSEIPKQMISIAGKPVFLHTLEVFENHAEIDEVILVTSKGILQECEQWIKKAQLKKITKILEGGTTRQESSKIGLANCDQKNTNKVLIHDAVRPFIAPGIISEVLKKLDKFVSVDVAIPAVDTLIETNEKSVIAGIPKRSVIYRGQTPQGFQFKTIMKAHEIATNEKFQAVTDDCGLIMKYKLGEIFVVQGDEENIKITHPIDIDIADKIFQIRQIQDLKPVNLSKMMVKKNVLIFGHSSGIGKEIFDLCKKHSANVSGYSLSNDFDVCDFEKVDNLINEHAKKHGKIDIIISTAGILNMERLEKTSLETILKQVDVNFSAQTNIVKSAINNMKKGGSIILFTSSSYTRGRANYSIYSATKAAIVNFVQAMAEELIEKEIRINAMCPSRTDTPMRRNNFGNEPKESLLEPQKVAMETLKVSLSDITGQVIAVRK